MANIIGFIIFSLIVILAIVETHILKVNVVNLKFNVPSEFRYIHISDIHNKTSFVNGRISKIINSEQPDFVVATGDYSNTQNKLSKVISELGNINSNVFLILGNYEREEEVSFLNKRNISLGLLNQEILKHRNLKLLVNDEVDVRIKESIISIYGFDNSVYGNEEYISKSIKLEEDYKIILAHSPNIINKVNKEKITYNHILVGHTHGKQINIPINKTAYDHYHIGLQKQDDCKFFSISNGLGTVRLPLRIRSRSSIDVYNIEK